MNIRFCALFLAGLLLTGCSWGQAVDEKMQANLLPKEKGEDTASLTDELGWVPLGLSRESYLVAEKRLSKQVRVGMTRSEFLDVMRLNPVLGKEWNNRITAGEGWLSELSRTNTYGNLNSEEFVFGFYQNHMLNERFAVILENGKVARIVRSPRSSHASSPAPPQKVFSNSLAEKEETELIQSFYRKELQTKKAYEKIVPELKRVRAGWTSAELRLALGGRLYRLPNGLVYLQEGLLWDEGFLQNGEGANSVVIMPFGYRDEKGKVHKQVIIRAESGLVTAVFWQSKAIQEAKPAEKK